MEMEEADKDWMMIRMVVGGCFFWYRLTRVVPDKGLQNGCCYELLCVASCVASYVLQDCF